MAQVDVHASFCDQCDAHYVDWHRLVLPCGPSPVCASSPRLPRVPPARFPNAHRRDLRATPLPLVLL